MLAAHTILVTGVTQAGADINLEATRQRGPSASAKAIARNGLRTLDAWVNKVVRCC